MGEKPERVCQRCKCPPPVIAGDTPFAFAAETWTLTISNGGRELRLCLNCVESLFLVLIRTFPYSEAEAELRAAHPNAFAGGA